jgi:hypothetical protein
MAFGDTAAAAGANGTGSGNDDRRNSSDDGGDDDDDSPNVGEEEARAVRVATERRRMASGGTAADSPATGTRVAHNDNTNNSEDDDDGGDDRTRSTTTVETSPVETRARRGRASLPRQVTPSAASAHDRSANTTETNDDDNHLGDNSTRAESSSSREVGSTCGRDGPDSRQMPTSGTAGMLDHSDDSDNPEESIVDYGKRRAKEELSPTQVIRIFEVTMLYDQYAHAKGIPSCMKQENTGVLMRNFARCLDHSDRCAYYKYNHLLAAHKFVTVFRFLELTAAEERAYDGILKNYRKKLSKDDKENWYEITHLDLLNIINKSLLRYGKGTSRCAVR